MTKKTIKLHEQNCNVPKNLQCLLSDNHKNANVKFIFQFKVEEEAIVIRVVPSYINSITILN